VIVDFLVNNAGFASLGPVAALDPDEVGVTVMENTAFVLSFTQAVCAEKADTGVRVLALCPGPTETPPSSPESVSAYRNRSF
jgi:short-subunit dehydrogenase